MINKFLLAGQKFQPEMHLRQLGFKYSACDHVKNKTGVELDLCIYATKSELKNAACVDTSQFAKKDDLANLKSELDKSDTENLEKCQVV